MFSVFSKKEPQVPKLTKQQTIDIQVYIVALRGQLEAKRVVLSAVRKARFDASRPYESDHVIGPMQLEITRLAYELKVLEEALRTNAEKEK